MTSAGGAGSEPATSVALYRKYRSATFAELIGQDHVTAPLSEALTNHRINHAYLFSGPRGCGKTSSARILARSLNCLQGPTASPCGVCDSCRELAPNGPGSIDVIEIDAASHGGVDDARDLRERAFYAPVRDRYKVYIIDEAHMVTTQGFNALLKLVEEPPDFLVFVFATTEPDKVLTTIRSRTHHYPFRLIPPTAMRTHIDKICAAEGIAVEPAVLPLVVRAGGGSARDSLSILDQLLSGAGPDGVTYARAVGLLGVTDGALLDDMVDALAVGDAVAVYGTIDRVVEAGHDPRRFAADLLDRFRDLIVLDAVPDAADRGLIDAAPDNLAQMADQAARIGVATLTRHAEIVHAALIEMRGTTSPRLVLELLCARMQLPDASADSAALLQRIERLERRQTLAQQGASPAEVAEVAEGGRNAAAPRPVLAPPPAASVAKATPAQAAPPPTAATESTAPAQRPAPADSTVPVPSRPAAPSSASASASASASDPAVPPAQPDGTLDSTAVRRLWPEVLEAVKRRSRRTRALLDNAQVSTLEDDLLTLRISTAPLAKMLGEASNAEVISAGMTEVIGGKWRISVEVSAAAAPPEAGAVAGPATDGWSSVPANTADTANPANPTGAPAGSAANTTSVAAMSADAGASAPDAGNAPPQRPVVPRPPAPRPASERTDSARRMPAAEPVDSDPRADTDESQQVSYDPEAEALRLLESTLGAKPMQD